MTPTTLAETILRDVSRYRHAYNLTIQPSEDGEYVRHADVLATLTAAMDPAIAERAGEVVAWRAQRDELDDLDRAADLITALLAQNAALRAERDEFEGVIKHRREPSIVGAVGRALRMKSEAEARAEAAEAQIAALTARVEGLTGALHNCVGMLDCLVAESGRSIEWGQEDPFRMGEWFEPEDLAQIKQARAALSATTEEGHDPQA